MKIVKKKTNGELTISLEGRLDTNTSPNLEKELIITDDLKSITFDLEKLEYISSSGLRILLSTEKKMNGKKVIIKNANEYVKEVLDMTGFSELFIMK